MKPDSADFKRGFESVCDEFESVYQIGNERISDLRLGSDLTLKWNRKNIFQATNLITMIYKHSKEYS